MFLRSKWVAKKNRSQVSDGDSLARAQKVWQLEGRENSYKDGMLGKKNTIFVGGSKLWCILICLSNFEWVFPVLVHGLDWGQTDTWEKDIKRFPQHCPTQSNSIFAAATWDNSTCGIVVFIGDVYFRELSCFFSLESRWVLVEYWCVLLRNSIWTLALRGFRIVFQF